MIKANAEQWRTRTLSSLISGPFVVKGTLLFSTATRANTLRSGVASIFMRCVVFLSFVCLVFLCKRTSWMNRPFLWTTNG